MPRFSRISWNSREEAEPPRIPSSSEAAKRRRSVRAIPGAAMQTWYCSVSLRWKRRLGGGGLTSAGRTFGPLRAGALARRCARTRTRRAPPPLCPHQQALELLVLQVPRGRRDDVAGHVHRAVVRRDRAARDAR